jgi:NTE family protein
MGGFGGRRVRPVHLALQGGGAHGALTWGVLDRLLDHGGFAVRAVSGTSAGAMNAVVMADGFARGGAEGARKALADFWRAVGEAARLSPIRPGLVDRLRGRYSLDASPGYLMLDGLARLVPPAALNPLGLDPLREILAAQVNFALVAGGPIAVHVTATDVRTGLPRTFSGRELRLDAVMASACLPQLQPAVEIGGEAYWDGGFSANPALMPLAEDRASRDIVLVQLSPSRRGPPRTGREIVDRGTEIAFSAALLSELRALAWAERRRPTGLRLHRIHGHETAEMPASSKLHAEWGHLHGLFERGRGWADDWLAKHGAAVGVVATFDAGALLPPARAPGLGGRLGRLRRRLTLRRWARAPGGSGEAGHDRSRGVEGRASSSV